MPKPAKKFDGSIESALWGKVPADKLRPVITIKMKPYVAPPKVDRPDCIHYKVCWYQGEYGDCCDPCDDYLPKDRVVIKDDCKV